MIEHEAVNGAFRCLAPHLNNESYKEVDRIRYFALLTVC